MPLKTKRWNDPIEPDDGFRLLICRYRPRGLTKSGETWQAWEPNLGPSKALLAAYHAKSASPIPWSVYRHRYLAEMRGQMSLIDALAARIKADETVTLLCSSACTRESRCHRSLLAELIRQSIAGT